MRFIPLPDGQRLSFYLAAEEYVSATLRPAADCWMMWQVGPSVICGRNQDIAAEVDLAYCAAHGIGVFRRKSGGGCVYADRGNVMLTFITPSDQVAFTYHRFVEMLLLLLREMVVEATHTGRNDILVGAHKVAGTAYHLTPSGHSVVHSTMLFDADMHHMQRAITPPPSKLGRHGVASVSQRIGLLSHHTATTPRQFIAMARKRLCTDELQLTDSDLAAIRTLEHHFIPQLPHNLQPTNQS
ncbi:MAG: lipoate--protein ligase family protein [Bacteroidaceae bacterium]|nr:lipoate--protein ligase family protein [Bacteroidaceae bacterium]